MLFCEYGSYTDDACSRWCLTNALYDFSFMELELIFNLHLRKPSVQLALLTVLLTGCPMSCLGGVWRPDIWGPTWCRTENAREAAGFILKQSLFSSGIIQRFSTFAFAGIAQRVVTQTVCEPFGSKTFTSAHQDSLPCCFACPLLNWSLPTISIQLTNCPSCVSSKLKWVEDLRYV